MEENKKEEEPMEQWEDVKKGQKTSPVAIVILVIALIAFAVLGFLSGSGLYSFTHKAESNNVTDEEETNINETEDEKEENLGTFDLSNFDATKVINGNPDTIYSSNNVTEAKESLIKDSSGSIIEFIKVELKDDKKTVTITANWGEMTNSESDDYTYEISNINNKIKKVYVNGFGQALGEETVFYLMADGTVEYTPLTYKIAKDAINNPKEVKLESYGKIQNVEGIVMIASASVGQSQGGGYQTTIAIKEDGSFYDLCEILKNTDEYK